MAIDRKELISRKYDVDNNCIGFEYNLIVEDEKGRELKIPFYFNRLAEKYWEVSMVSKNKNFGELRAYSTEYEIPKSNLNLELVAAFGLRYIQYIFQQEIQFKSMIDFCIGDTISNMS